MVGCEICTNLRLLVMSGDKLPRWKERRERGGGMEGEKDGKMCGGEGWFCYKYTDIEVPGRKNGRCRVFR